MGRRALTPKLDEPQAEALAPQRFTDTLHIARKAGFSELPSPDVLAAGAS